jgi:hypothetical protein
MRTCHSAGHHMYTQAYKHTYVLSGPDHRAHKLQAYIGTDTEHITHKFLPRTSGPVLLKTTEQSGIYLIQTKRSTYLARKDGMTKNIPRTNTFHRYHKTHPKTPLGRYKKKRGGFKEEKEKNNSLFTNE